MSYRKMVEDYIGRELDKDERVHHINKDHNDNRLENLFVFHKKKYHDWWHYLDRAKRGYLPDHIYLKSNLDELKNKDHVPKKRKSIIKRDKVDKTIIPTPRLKGTIYGINSKKAKEEHLARVKQRGRESPDIWPWALTGCTNN